MRKNILGNIDNHKGEGLVAFIDILGFSEEILSNWNDPKNDPLKKILNLKKNIPVQSDKNAPKVKLDKSFERIYKCRIQTISDSIVVSFGFNNNNLVYGDLVLGTITFFETIAVIWRNSLESGYTIRGAVDWGEIYWDSKEIIGPAFITAYKLESTQAKSSRVIISSSFNRELANIAKQYKTFWNDFILDCVYKDIDGYLILNPHKLYDPDRKNDKNKIIEILHDLQNKAKNLNKEKYNPILAAMESPKINITNSDFGKY